MSTDQKQGLVKRQGLTRAELAEIRELAEKCNAYERLDLKLNWNILETRQPDQTNDFLYYENGLLVGFLPLYSFNSTEAEFSGMVHPDYRRRGIYTALYQEARAECRSRGLTKILLIVEPASPAGQAFVHTLGTTYDHSEYKMVLEEPRLPALVDERLRFRPATPDDISLLAHITAVSFKLPEDDINWYTTERFEQAENGFYVAELDGVVIGKIDVAFSAYGGHIYGFGVLPEYQGRGYGRQILARTIQEILTMGQPSVTLEVAVENKHALSLYHSCGFKETSSYDYYAIAVE